MNTTVQDAVDAVRDFGKACGAASKRLDEVIEAVRALDKPSAIESLFKRIKNLKIPVRTIFEHAGVDPSLAYKWKANTPVSVTRWLSVLAIAKVECPPPGVSTWEHLGSNASKAFLAAGYSAKEINDLWFSRDSLPVENYKKVLFTVKRCENARASKSIA